MVGRLIAFTISALICGFCEYNMVELVDFPANHEIKKSKYLKLMFRRKYNPPEYFSMVTAVLKLSAVIFAVVSCALGFTLGLLFGAEALQICYITIMTVHFLYGFALGILDRKHSREPHNHKYSKWL